MINDRNSESGGWSLAGDRGDSEQVVGGHWQKTEETMTMVGGHWQETEETMKKWWGGHWQKTEETVKSGGVVTGRRQWNWWLTTCKTLGNW